MDDRPVVVLNGEDLTVGDIVAIGIGDKKVALDPAAVKRCQASRDFLKKQVDEKKIIYGVNTSYGPMCNKIIRDDEMAQLQENLIVSHAAGLGDPLKPYVALGVLVVRLNTLVKGYSGVRVELLETMVKMINAGLAPYIPECGSVGASGDLIHLAHMGLAIIGKGQVYLKGELMSAEDAYAKVDFTPFVLGYKEGIALINGTAAMTSIAAFAVFSAKKLFNVAVVNASFAMEIFGGINDAFDYDLHRVKPHPGQVKVAELIRNLTSGSKNITHRKNITSMVRAEESLETEVFETSVTVQDVYSIRCTPQVLAPAWEAIQYAEKTVETEANSTNDNPVIIPEEGKIIHGGNFHGQSISFAMDQMAIGVSTLCNISERRLNKLLDKNLNEGLPEHLIPGTLGLTMGFMGSQYLATSTTAENRTMASPVSVNTISCNASNQDVVSMGTIAARKANKLVSNAKHILTMETLADLQAFTFRNADTMAPGIAHFYKILNDEFSVYDNGRIFHDDLVKFRKILFSSQIFDDIASVAEKNAASC